MQTIIHRSDSRGEADHGWLYSRHTFSFANYHNPERMQFGTLRVINDDIVKPGRGFDTHPHENMEIVSIPLKGCLNHKDSMGNEHIIRHGEVQIMSAGKGIQHSEYNHSNADDVNFLQIWILPKEMNIEPRYDQKEFDLKDRKNQFHLVVSPDKNDSESVWINQNAYFSLGDFEAGNDVSYQTHSATHGIYVFVIDGKVEIANESINARDAIGITDTNSANIRAAENSTLLIIETPLD